MRKQYALIYKPSKIILAVFCTKEAAWQRLKFISDSGLFGVFEVNFDTHITNSSFIWTAVIIHSTGKVLNIFSDMNMVTDSCRNLVKAKYCYYDQVQYSFNGKELKEEVDNADDLR